MKETVKRRKQQLRAMKRNRRERPRARNGREVVEERSDNVMGRRKSRVKTQKYLTHERNSKEKEETTESDEKETIRRDHRGCVERREVAEERNDNVKGRRKSRMKIG